MTDQTDAVTVKFSLTSSDLFWALAGHTIRQMWFMLLLPIVGAVSVMWAILSAGEPPISLVPAFGLFVFGTFLFVGQPLIQARSAMKSPNFGGVMTLTVSEEGIEFVGEHSNAMIRWPMVKRVSEMSHALLIYLKPAGFQVIPKRRLSQADITAIKNVLRVHTSR